MANQGRFIGRWKIATCVVGLCLPLGSVTGCHSGGGSSQSVVQAVTRPFMPTPPVKLARGMFDKSDARRRRRSVARVAQTAFGDQRVYLKAYRKLTRDPEKSVRAAAARALAKNGTAADAQVLAHLLDDPSPFVRWRSAWALRRLHNPAAISGLIEATKDDDADVRAAATQALGQYPRSDVFDTLVSRLTDHDYAVQRTAHHELATLTGQHLGLEPGDWLDWADGHRGELFAEAQPYTYRPWTAPPGWVERLVTLGFAWRPTAQPMRPTGI